LPVKISENTFQIVIVLINVFSLIVLIRPIMVSLFKISIHCNNNHLFMLALLITSCILSLIVIVLLFTRGTGSQTPHQLLATIDELSKKLDAQTSSIRDEFKQNRQESSAVATENRKELADGLAQFRKEMTEALTAISQLNKIAADQVNRTLDEKMGALTEKLDRNNKENRETITANLKEFSAEQKKKFDELKKEQKEMSAATVLQLDKIINTVEERLNHLNEQAKKDQAQMRDALVTAFNGFQQAFDKNVRSFNEVQREKFGHLEEKQNALVESTGKRLDGIREMVEEKLQKTLQDRIGQSFEMVSKQLTAVQQGLGEMQTLAQDVGGLKKVLSNVKMRGGFGEVQLHMLLESILAPEQYEANVATKKASSDRVEFAVKFPNKENDRDYVWLPIDAKFPKEAYESLQAAYEAGDLPLIETAQRSLEAVIKKMAKDICEKYIDAPNTTNFGIMFLPFEGLFAEVVRKASLLEEIQRDCHVVITGPTTLAVILNSLQMGFRTLAIQKRSSEVWKTLSAVKKEFNQFGGMLEKAQKNIQTGLNQLDDLAGVRTRAIQRQLKGVETLSNVDGKTEISELADRGIQEEVE
jgi:DNA recombination protein RmuC